MDRKQGGHKGLMCLIVQQSVVIKGERRRIDKQRDKATQSILLGNKTRGKGIIWRQVRYQGGTPIV